MLERILWTNVVWFKGVRNKCC